MSHQYKHVHSTTIRTKKEAFRQRAWHCQISIISQFPSSESGVRSGRNPFEYDSSTNTVYATFTAESSQIDPAQLQLKQTLSYQSQTLWSCIHPEWILFYLDQTGWGRVRRPAEGVSRAFASSIQSQCYIATLRALSPSGPAGRTRRCCPRRAPQLACLRFAPYQESESVWCIPTSTWAWPRQ